MAARGEVQGGQGVVLARVEDGGSGGPLLLVRAGGHVGIGRAAHLSLVGQLRHTGRTVRRAKRWVEARGAGRVDGRGRQARAWGVGVGRQIEARQAVVQGQTTPASRAPASLQRLFGILLATNSTPCQPSPERERERERNAQIQARMEGFGVKGVGGGGAE
ncbi:hypothetical protein VTK73DRAFT_3619 [Phialemonium thermophilum]|uniref:Uncharacterized protein n=1 Tax=Phialemonium thermophilum TaxID=223376 RepID=A0ABR3VGP4_9PEZI